MKPHEMQPGDAVLVVDVQNDFCPGGALAIDRGDEVIPRLNRWVAAAREIGLPVYASRDFHPRQHVSFRESGGLWPPHCLQDTPGAAFHPALELPEDAVVITKGVRLDKDQNSAFDETGLAVQLRRDGVRRLFVGGLALDVCVRASVLDARHEGFEVHLIPHASKPVSEAEGERAKREMRQAGAVVEDTE